VIVASTLLQAAPIALFALFGLLLVGGTLALYAAIRDETGRSETMDRETAERVARERARERNERRNR
jgi:hypothetical protein